MPPSECGSDIVICTFVCGCGEANFSAGFLECLIGEFFEFMLHRMDALRQRFALIGFFGALKNVFMFSSPPPGPALSAQAPIPLNLRSLQLECSESHWQCRPSRRPRSMGPGCPAILNAVTPPGPPAPPPGGAAGPLPAEPPQSAVTRPAGSCDGESPDSGSSGSPWPPRGN